MDSTPVELDAKGFPSARSVAVTRRATKTVRPAEGHSIGLDYCFGVRRGIIVFGRGNSKKGEGRRGKYNNAVEPRIDRAGGGASP